MNVEVNVEDRVFRPVDEVFAAIVEPERMSRYFLTHGSGPLKAGATVQWEFADVGRSVAVHVIQVEPDHRIDFEWSASGVRAHVTILLEPAGANTTIVSIREAGWPMDAQGVRRALEQTHGWTDFLCCMKAYLQHGVKLRRGRLAAGTGGAVQGAA